MIELKKHDLNHLVENVIQWAWDRALINKKNIPAQAMKVNEEWGETCKAYFKSNEQGLIDGIGDTLVTLIIFAEQNGYDIRDCLNVAWNEIKDRKGKTIDGTFIKES